MSKIASESEVELRSLISIISAPSMQSFRIDFQSFSEADFSFGGRSYSFIDSSITELHSRHAQFSTLPKRLIIRNAPVASQRGDTIMPGLTTNFVSSFTLATPLDLIKNFDGLRQCAVQIKYVYLDSAQNYKLDRSGESEIVETETFGSEIAFKLNNMMIPNRATGLVRVV